MTAFRPSSVRVDGERVVAEELLAHEPPRDRDHVIGLRGQRREMRLALDLERREREGRREHVRYTAKKSAFIVAVTQRAKAAR